VLLGLVRGYGPVTSFFAPRTILWVGFDKGFFLHRGHGVWVRGGVGLGCFLVWDGLVFFGGVCTSGGPGGLMGAGSLGGFQGGVFSGLGLG